MQLLSHLCVAASHWPTAIHGRHQATRPWPLTRFHGRTLSFFHEVRVAHRLHGPTSHCFMLCASECCTAQQAAVVHVPPPPPPPPSPTSTTTTRLADDEEPSPRLRDCCVRCWSVCATTGGPLALPLACSAQSSHPNRPDKHTSAFASPPHMSCLSVGDHCNKARSTNYCKEQHKQPKTTQWTPQTKQQS